MHRHARALVFDEAVGKFIEQPPQPIGETADALHCFVQIWMGGAYAVGFDLEAVEAGVVHTVRKARAPLQVVEPAPADDPERQIGPPRHCEQQLVAFGGQLRGGRVGVEFGQRAVEIQQQHKRGVGGPIFNCGLHLRQHSL